MVILVNFNVMKEIELPDNTDFSKFSESDFIKMIPRIAFEKYWDDVQLQGVYKNEYENADDEIIWEP